MSDNLLNFGIEYELENIQAVSSRANALVKHGWRTERDGTLREGGYEFVMEGKQPIDKAKQSCEALLKELRNRFTISHRCSTHIHVDTQHLNVAARISLLLGLIIHDDWFFQFDPARQYNNFCTPVLYSPAAIVAINQSYHAPMWGRSGNMITSKLSRETTRLSNDDTKYMSINTMPLNRFGTVELRHFSPMVNLEDMYTVLDKIEEIYNVAKGVRKGKYKGALKVWSDFGEQYPDRQQAINWVQHMFTTHSKLIGEL